MTDGKSILKRLSDIEWRLERIEANLYGMEDDAKYKLLPHNYIIYKGKKLYRIQYQKGLLGGFLESEENLSQEGTCGVWGDAKVYDDARVFEDAQVKNTAEVYGNALVYMNAEVAGDARVGGWAVVMGNAKVTDNAQVGGYAVIKSAASVRDNAKVYDAYLTGTSKARGNIQITGRAHITNFGEVESK